MSLLQSISKLSQLKIFRKCPEQSICDNRNEVSSVQAAEFPDITALIAEMKTWVSQWLSSHIATEVIEEKACLFQEVPSAWSNWQRHCSLLSTQLKQQFNVSHTFQFSNMLQNSEYKPHYCLTESIKSKHRLVKAD